MSNKTTDTKERREMLTQICDAESYLPIITACLDEGQAKKLNPRHMANFMALSAELLLSNYPMIADAFERNNGLEITFKARLAQEKDNVEIAFKPVDVFKDSASANLPDDDQAEFDFKPKAAAPAESSSDPVTVDAEIVCLPPPAKGLPAPSSDGEQDGNPGDMMADAKAAAKVLVGKSAKDKKHTEIDKIGLAWGAAGLRAVLAAGGGKIAPVFTHHIENLIFDIETREAEEGESEAAV